MLDREAVRSRLGTALVLDVRAGERYRGETEPVDPVAGHIPTATNAPTVENLSGGRMRSPEELRERLVALGADGGREVVVACGSGVNAAHSALAFRVAGLPDPLLYAGSYSEWSRSGMPVATGADPGAIPAGLREA